MASALEHHRIWQWKDGRLEGTRAGSKRDGELLRTHSGLFLIAFRNSEVGTSDGVSGQWQSIRGPVDQPALTLLWAALLADGLVDKED